MIQVAAKSAYTFTAMTPICSSCLFCTQAIVLATNGR